MNIFATNKCPVKSAKFLDDKRVVKMVLESAQMLSTAINHYKGVGPYKSTHMNHPCNVWVRSSRSNYMWLVGHFKALCDEYKKRYNKTHKCEQYLNLFIDNRIVIPDNPATEFVNCARNSGLGVDFSAIKDTCEAYKQYLFNRWSMDKRVSMCKLGRLYVNK